jgi:hypothetical protein
VELRQKKQKHCDPLQAEENGHGDQWDHIALAVKSRFVVTMVIDKRTPEALQAQVADFADRTGGRAPRLVTTDDCAAYEPVLLAQYGQEVQVLRKDGQPDGRFRPVKVWPEGSVYGTITKTYKKGEVLEARRKLALGTPEQLAQALAASAGSETINTSFVERQNGTDRTHNSRKARKTLSFSKDLVVHMAVSWWVMFCYNFHFLNAGLTEAVGYDFRRRRCILKHRTPAMAQGLTDRPWTVERILFTQLSMLPSGTEVTPAYFRPWKRRSPPAPHHGPS